MVKTHRSTSQQSVMPDSDYISSAYTVTQDSNQWHDCHAGQPQQPGLAKRLPETDGAKVLPTSDQMMMMTTMTTTVLLWRTRGRGLFCHSSFYSVLSVDCSWNKLNCVELCWCVDRVGVDEDRETQSFESLGMVTFYHDFILQLAEKRVVDWCFSYL